MDRNTEVKQWGESDTVSGTLFDISGCINRVDISIISSEAKKVSINRNFNIYLPWDNIWKIHILSRFQKGESTECPKVLFENVTREDADKSVSLLIKYLFNYGFYKFGVEITLVMLVILISYRQDTVSIAYVIWLCVIIRTNRRTKQFIWPIFQFFVMIVTITQYAIVLNLPTILYSSELLIYFFTEVLWNFIPILQFMHRFSMGIWSHSTFRSIDWIKRKTNEAFVWFHFVDVHLSSTECVPNWTKA